MSVSRCLICRLAPGRPGGSWPREVRSQGDKVFRRQSVIGLLPPFAWTQFPNTPHMGLPPVYEFEFEEMTPAFV